MNNERKLIALKIERREIAAAIFTDTRIEHVDRRQLSSDHERADSSALGFIHWLVTTFGSNDVALEGVGRFAASRRGALTRQIESSLQRSNVLAWKVRKPELMASYGFPPVRTRKQIRSSVRSIWPVFADSEDTIVDAVALGLYVQTERLFSY